MGRKNEIDDFFATLNEGQKPDSVIIGEAGIGKSSYINEIVTRIRTHSSETHTFVGLNSVLDGTTNPASPFIRAIDDLMSNLAVPLENKVEVQCKRLKNVCKKIFLEKGKTLAKALAKTVAIKLLNKEAVDEIEEFAKEFVNTPTIDSLGEDIFSKHRDDFVYDLTYFVNQLVEEYKNLRFVLIFDQFERAPFVSYGIFLGLIRGMSKKSDRLHTVVSLKAGKESITNFTTIKPELAGLHAKFLTLPPMTEQEIGEWMSQY